MTGAGVDANGKKTFTDCDSPYYRSDYDREAYVLYTLETTFKCTGFSNSINNNYFTFSDVNKIPIPGNNCANHWNKMLIGYTYSIGSQFFGISMGAMFLMFWMIIVAINFKVKNQLGNPMSGADSMGGMRKEVD